MEGLQNDFGVDWDICMTCKTVSWKRGVSQVLLIKLPFESSKVYWWRALAGVVIIDIHGGWLV